MSFSNGATTVPIFLVAFGSMLRWKPTRVFRSIPTDVSMLCSNRALLVYGNGKSLTKYLFAFLSLLKDDGTRLLVIGVHRVVHAGDLLDEVQFWWYLLRACSDPGALVIAQLAKEAKMAECSYSPSSGASYRPPSAHPPRTPG